MDGALIQTSGGRALDTNEPAVPERNFSGANIGMSGLMNYAGMLVYILHSHAALAPTKDRIRLSTKIDKNFQSVHETYLDVRNILIQRDQPELESITRSSLAACLAVKARPHHLLQSELSSGIQKDRQRMTRRFAENGSYHDRVSLSSQILDKLQQSPSSHQGKSVVVMVPGLSRYILNHNQSAVPWLGQYLADMVPMKAEYVYKRKTMSCPSTAHFLTICPFSPLQVKVGTGFQMSPTREDRDTTFENSTIDEIITQLVEMVGLRTCMDPFILCSESQIASGFQSFSPNVLQRLGCNRGTRRMDGVLHLSAAATASWVLRGEMPRTTLRDTLAIDCEMVELVGGKEVPARVSLVNAEGDTVYDTLISPDGPVNNYRTGLSGITAELLSTATTNISEVKQFLSDLVHDSHKLFVGHSVNHDFEVLNIYYPYVSDTSVLYPHPHPPMRWPLIMLTKKYLGLHNERTTEGHNPIVDAKLAMALFMRRVFVLQRCAERNNLKLEHSSHWMRFEHPLATVIPPVAINSPEKSISSAMYQQEFPDILDCKKKKKRANFQMYDHRSAGGWKGGVHVIDSWPISKDLRESSHLRHSRITASCAEDLDNKTSVLNDNRFTYQTVAEIRNQPLPFPTHPLSVPVDPSVASRLVVSIMRDVQEVQGLALGMIRQKPDKEMSKLRRCPKHWSSAYTALPRRFFHELGCDTGRSPGLTFERDIEIGEGGVMSADTMSELFNNDRIGSLCPDVEQEDLNAALKKIDNHCRSIHRALGNSDEMIIYLGHGNASRFFALETIKNTLGAIKPLVDEDNFSFLRENCEEKKRYLKEMVWTTAMEEVLQEARRECGDGAVIPIVTENKRRLERKNAM